MNRPSCKHGGKAIADEVPALLIGTHERGLSFKEIAVLYGVKEDTAYRIYSHWLFTAKK
jgi:hypothetical protein